MCLTKYHKSISDCPNQSNTRLEPATSTNATNRLGCSTATPKIDLGLVYKTKFDARVLELIKFSTGASHPYKHQKLTRMRHSIPTNGLEPGWRNTQDQREGARTMQVLDLSLSTPQKINRGWSKTRNKSSSECDRNSKKSTYILSQQQRSNLRGFKELEVKQVLVWLQKALVCN